MEHKTFNIVKNKFFLIKPKPKKYTYKVVDTYLGNNVTIINSKHLCFIFIYLQLIGFY